MKVQRPWTTSEVSVLRKLKTSPEGMGLGGKRIAKMSIFAGRTPGSISHAIHSHGLADPIRTERSLTVVRLSDENKERLRDFLKNEGRYWPSPKVAQRFNVSETTVLKNRRSLGICFTHQEAMADEVYRKWWKANRKNRLYGFKQSAKSKHRRIRKMLLERAEAVAGKDKSLEKRACAVCRSKWYVSDEFFHRIDYKKKDGCSSTYLSGICLACPKKARPKKKNSSKFLGQEPIG